MDIKINDVFMKMKTGEFIKVTGINEEYVTCEGDYSSVPINCLDAEWTTLMRERKLDRPIYGSHDIEEMASKENMFSEEHSKSAFKVGFVYGFNNAMELIFDKKNGN